MPFPTGITPRTIVRRVMDIMEGAREAANDDKPARGKGRGKVAEVRIDYSTLTPEQLSARIRTLEQQMYKHAQDLEFEEAGKVRDEIRRIKAVTLGA